MTEAVKYITFGVLAVLGLVRLRETWFSILSLRHAIREKRNGVTKRNYLRWEMPDNDIENQIQDEIRINILFLTGIALGYASLFAFPANLLIPSVIYSVIAFCSEKGPLEERYLAFYDFFKTKTRREDFSDELVIYGLRIEGTLTKLKKSQVFSVVYVLMGIIMLFA